MLSKTWLASALLILSSLSFIGLGSQPSQNAERLLPVDEAVGRPDFFTFRANLQTAIARHDAQAVMAVVHPQIKNGFGGDDGAAAFRRIWRINDADSDLWKELGAVLALGGSFTGDTFTAPYVFSRWPSDVDSFDHVAVIGANVRLRSAPSLNATTVASVGFSILELDSNSASNDESEWTAVRWTGRRAYIAKSFVRSSVGYRAAFTNSGGRWLMTYFLAGD